MPELVGKKDTCLKAALGYLARGWSVVPVAERGKRPMVRWQTFEDRHPTEAEVRGWFERWPSSNIAIVTGAISGIVVLDVDLQHGGEESLKRLASRNAGMPLTVEAATGGGGRHIYFKHPGFAVGNRAGLAPGLDLRGDGGVIIVPPSIHPSGKSYSWCKGQAPEDITLAPLPDWLLVPRYAGPTRGHPLSYWRTLVREGVSEGQRNATIASFTGHLLWHGVDPDVTLELMLAWNRVHCRPPLEDEEVIRAVHSIERTHARGNDDPSAVFDQRSGRPTVRRRQRCEVKRAAERKEPMAKLKLTYFDFHGGRGEPARLALSIGGIAFEDDRIQPVDWERRKADTPFGALPVLEVEGQTVAQSNAINRYVGKLADLYPSDPWQAALCDEAMEAVEDITTKIGATFFLPEEQKKAQRKTLVEGPIPFYLTRLQQRLEAHGGRYFAADRLSVADLKVFVWIRYLKSGALDHVPTDLPDRVAPKLLEHYERIKSDPRVKAYYAKHGIAG